MSELIANSPLKKVEIEKILHEYFKTDIPLSKAEGVIISKGLGFTSDIIRINLEWEEKNGLPLKVVVKVPKTKHLASVFERLGIEANGHDAASDENTTFIPLIHEKECTAYKLLLVDRPIPIPKVFGYQLVTELSPGFIVMEDLNERAGLVDNIAADISLNQWQSMVECLADLHAWSLTTDIPWREEVEDITCLKDVYAKCWTNQSAEIQRLKTKYPEYFAHVDEERHLEATTMENIIAKNMLHKDIMPDMMQHGDAWLNNIMFAKNADGTLSDKVAAFIDWQAAVRGCGVYDVARLECLCINHDQRRTNRKAMLKLYFDRLKSKSGDKLTATFEQIEYLYQESFAITTLSWLPWVNFMVQNIALVDQNETNCRKREFLNRMRASYDDAVKYYGWPSKIGN